MSGREVHPSPEGGTRPARQGNRQNEPAQSGDPQVGTGQVGHADDLRAAHVGHSPGRLRQRQLDQPLGDLPASTGWMSVPAGTGMTGDLTSARRKNSTRSWNWVVRRMVQGRPDRSIMPSTSNLDR
ncbi:hypothetical protein [Streptosporangium canum]|uniref:hypothetical protein n=1 Tax=Streptosporangium canum TaxID=324952 RepID=UPI00378F2679